MGSARSRRAWSARDWRSSDRKMLIDQLPQIVKEAAAGLAGANLTVLNGSDGLSEVAAGLVSQGLAILESVKKSMSGPASNAVTAFELSPVENGTAPGTAAAQSSRPATG